MASVAIPQEEYDELIDKAKRYDCLKQIMVEDIFAPPPTHSARQITKEFRATRKYGKEFLDSLARGLKRSSYFEPGGERT